MLKKLMSLFGKKSWENSEVFDYTSPRWGNALQFPCGFSQKKKFDITGHCSNKGILFAPVPKAGDTLLVKFTNGQVGNLRIHRIEFFRDPSDMFSATVKFEGLKAEEVGDGLQQAE